MRMRVRVYVCVEHRLRDSLYTAHCPLPDRTTLTHSLQREYRRLITGRRR